MLIVTLTNGSFYPSKTQHWHFFCQLEQLLSASNVANIDPEKTKRSSVSSIFFISFFFHFHLTNPLKHFRGCLIFLHSHFFYSIFFLIYIFKIDSLFFWVFFVFVLSLFHFVIPIDSQIKIRVSVLLTGRQKYEWRRIFQLLS